MSVPVSEMPKPRYRLYLEHKFVNVQLTQFEHVVATADFSEPAQVKAVKDGLEGVINLMEGHAKHENDKIHPLLHAKQSQLGPEAARILADIEKDHKHYQEIFADLRQKIATIERTRDLNEIRTLGYNFYMAYRHFLAIDLKHINEEEDILMTELQKLYTDNQIREAVDFPVYAEFSPDDMVGMVTALFPTMNVYDKAHFIQDLHDAQPAKFKIAWPGIAKLLTEAERKKLRPPLLTFDPSFVSAVLSGAAANASVSDGDAAMTDAKIEADEAAGRAATNAKAGAKASGSDAGAAAATPITHSFDADRGRTNKRAKTESANSPASAAPTAAPAVAPDKRKAKAGTSHL